MLTVDSAVFTAYPGAKMGILAMQNVNASAPADSRAAEQAMEAVRSQYGGLDRAGLKALDPIGAYVSYYKKFGYSYHVLAQLESVLSGKRTIHAETGLLAAMFQTELESMLLTAGHDLAKLRLPLSLKLAAGTERYVSISGKEAAAVAGDMAVCSGGSVISSILRGPDYNSRITPETQGVVFTLYAPPGFDAQTLLGALHKLEERISAFSPACGTLELSVYPRA